MLTDTSISRFRTRYLQAFGASASRDALYESVSAGRMHPGIEHWLPLFHDQLATLADYCRGGHCFWTMRGMRHPPRGKPKSKIFSTLATSMIKMMPRPIGHYPPISFI